MVIIASTRAATGVYPDRDRPGDRGVVAGQGFCTSTGRWCGPTDRMSRAALADGGGCGPGDHLRRHRHLADRPHPAGTAALLDYQIPGLAAAIRVGGQRQGADRGAVPRGGRGRRPNAGRQSARLDRRGAGRLAVLDRVLDHALDQSRGGDHQAGG